MYRALRNISISRHGIVLKDHPVDPSWLSEAGVERLLARGYIEVVVAEAEKQAAAVDTVAAMPLTAIRGIGKERAKKLVEQGLESVAALARTTPEQLRAYGLTAKQIADWQAQAELLLAPAATKTTTSGGTCERCKAKKNAR